MGNPATFRKLLDSLYFIWYSTVWVRVRISSDCGGFSAAFFISGAGNSSGAFLKWNSFGLHFGSAAACRRFSSILVRTSCFHRFGPTTEVSMQLSYLESTLAKTLGGKKPRNYL
jgi:hypothetical protein